MLTFLATSFQMIRERISTATVLLLAHTARNLHYLFVRRNAVILRCDWPQSPDWSYEFYQWLRSSSKSYDTTEKEVSQILGYTWFMLSDQQFKLTRINLHYKPFWKVLNVCVPKNVNSTCKIKYDLTDLEGSNLSLSNPLTVKPLT